eukprot:6203745-Pleurochrysis_carterae.AAC.1
MTMKSKIDLFEFGRNNAWCTWVLLPQLKSAVGQRSKRSDCIWLQLALGRVPDIDQSAGA